MAGFSDGLMAGFSVMETIRDRKAARTNEARRISLAEAAEARAGQAFNLDVEDRARGLAREDQLLRAAAAKARIFSDPDNANPEDIRMVQEAGDAETMSVLDLNKIRGQSAQSLRDLASQAGEAGMPGDQVTQSGSPPTRGGLPFSPQQYQFLAPSEDSELAPNRFAEPKFVPLEDIASFLAPNDPYLQRSGRTRGLDLSTPEARAAAAVSNSRSGARVPIDPSLKTPAEIDQMPVVEQEAARAQLKEALGGRQKWYEDTQANYTAGGNKPQMALNDQYAAMIDSRQDSELRQLATTQPTAWIERYRADRLSLDPNTRALVDRRAVEISKQSQANLHRQVGSVPVRNGTIDFSSPEGQALKRGIEQNIAVLSQAEAGFSPAKAADIRGGYMPVGNRELTGRVVDAAASQELPVYPPTENEERMLRTQLNRVDQQNSGGPARRLSSAQIDVFSKAVARGLMTLKDFETLLLTGRLTGSALELKEFDPKKDLYLGNRLVRRGYDPEAAGETRTKLADGQWDMVQDQMKLLYPGDSTREVNLQGRRAQQALVYFAENRERFMRDGGFDIFAATPAQTAAALNDFAQYDAADSQWSGGYLGLRGLFYGELREQGSPDEINQIVRDLNGPEWGVTSIGGLSIRTDLARRRLLESSDPRDAAAYISTQGNDEALIEYMRSAYPEAFPGGAAQE